MKQLSFGLDAKYSRPRWWFQLFNDVLWLLWPPTSLCLYCISVLFGPLALFIAILYIFSFFLLFLFFCCFFSFSFLLFFCFLCVNSNTLFWLIQLFCGYISSFFGYISSFLAISALFWLFSSFLDITALFWLYKLFSKCLQSYLQFFYVFYNNMYM